MTKLQTVAITGANAGLGKALALEYAQEDRTLFLAARNIERLEEVAALCRERGATVHVQSLDVCKVEEVEQWVKDCAYEKPLELVIANAGIMHSHDEVEEAQAIEVSHRQINTNLNAVITLVTAAHQVMKNQPVGQNGVKGQIGIVASLSAMQPIGDIAAYSASKAGVTAYGEAMGEYLAKRKIEVSVVCPGFIKTDMLAGHSGFRPFAMTAEYAARKTKLSFDRKAPYYAFPLPLVFITLLGRLLPTRLRRLVTAGFGFKSHN